MGQVIQKDELLLRLASHRQQAETIVSTNGCFDLLHVGHLRYLQASKALGDILVLAVNSDASVQRLKGPKRPIVPEAERAELLAALSCVDYVVLFNEDSPVDFLCELKPDIHVKGSQYSEETLPEAPALRAIGTQLKFVEMIEDRSTSSLIERILDAYRTEAAQA